MNKTSNYFKLLIFSFVLLYSCALFGPGISSFDQYSYTQTTAIKVDVIDLMDLATEDFQLHQKEIAKVNSDIRKIYEYEKHRPKNEIIIKQWDILIDTSAHLFGGFMAKWKKEGKMGKVYLGEKKKQISFAFDQIVELESKKIKPSDIK